MPSLSLLFGFGFTLSSLASATKYTAQDTYAGSSFFDSFNFVTEEKTNGFVKYVDRSRAESQGYINYKDGDAIFGVDYKSKLDSSSGKDVGRESVRLEGKKEYNKGLFVLDVKHMPGGICGTWPAFWSLGREPWPVKGEIDIIEGVNMNSVNKFVLHTDTQCKTDGKGQTGAQSLYNCALDSPSGASGCDVNDVNTSTYGAGFNANVGGYYVTEWQADGIRMWFFPRGSAPKSLQTGEPDTSEFGTPNANFQGDCDIEKRFMDQRFIFTNTFCGDWAGNVYANSGCPMYSGLSGMDSCKKYVAENPAVFKDAYWRISSFKTYNKRMLSSSSSVAPSSTHASSSSVRVSSSTPVSSSVHISSSSVYASSSVQASSSSVQASSSSAHVSSSVAHISSALSSSVIYSSATPTPHVSSSIYDPASTPAASSSYPHSIPSSVASSTTPPDYVSSSSEAHGFSSIYSPSISYDYTSSSAIISSVTETPYSHGISSSIYSAFASETPYPNDSPSINPSASSSYAVSSDVSSIYPSETPYSSSSVVYSSETPYDSSIYPSGTSSSSAYPDVTSYPVDKSSSSTPVSPNPSSAPIYSAYPEDDGYEYGSISSKTLHASSKASEYPIMSTTGASSMPSGYPAFSSKYPEASSKVPDHDNEYPATSSKASDYGTYPAVSAKVTEHSKYPVASSSAPVYGDDHPSYPISSPIPVYESYPVSTPGVKSTPAYADYPELPSFTPLYSTYPAVSSKPSYDDQQSSDSYKTTTAYETTYVDICPTGYTTITTKVTAIQTPAPYPTTDAHYAPPGFEVMTKYCAQGCGEGPKTVTVTVPCSKCQASMPVYGKPTDKVSSVYSKSTDVPSKPTGNAPYTPAQPIKPSTPEDSTTKITATEIVTLTKIPVPESQYYATHPSIASASAISIKYPDSDLGKSSTNSRPVVPTGYAGSDKPYPTASAPSSKPVYPTVAGHAGGNITMSYGTGASAAGKPTQTGYEASEFTGAASGVQVGGVVAGAVAVFAAMMM
ncbi:uncharacterized protein EKO05_0010676 [Ascochyta rabiei]|uniref:uncharacterized protein n=1 Tax=Didymella rabiei TaxID=5454 RepID=UPI0019016BAB|nr:uncharacterized protein EKO05_0010676 [Ascochyta rabiei]UPX20445.1 hypothetical protein EKO05_0010676 [Ascochyta rabiei]